MERRALLAGLVIVAFAALPGFAADAVAARTGADLAVTKTADRRTAREGDSVTYTISLKNRGPETAINVLLEEGAPDELGVTAFDCGGGIPVPQAAFSCLYGSLAKGDRVTVTFVATVTPDADPGELVTNTASVSQSSPADPNDRNDADTATIRIVE